MAGETDGAVPPGKKPRDPAERFWEKVDVGHPLGCWMWAAGQNGRGYGRFRVGSMRDGSRRVVQAHRWAYEHLMGSIPKGLVLDHLCLNTLCVNPDHLEPVTSGENVSRAVSGRSQSEEHVRKIQESRGLKGHGTAACRNRGCRCDPCVEAYRKYWRVYNRKRRPT